MELTYEEQLQLDNSKEHLKVVLSNVRMASDDLTRILKAIEVANIELEKVSHEKEVIAIENSKTTNEILKNKIAQDTRLQSIVEKENKQKEVSEEFKKMILIASNEFESVTNKVGLAKSQYEKITKEKEGEIKSLKEEVSKYKVEIEKNKQDVSIQFRIKQDIEKDIVRLSNEREESKKGLDRFKSNAAIEVKQVTQNIEEEKNKIKNPLELIRRESEALAILKNDLEIIKSRLTQQFKEQNPERNIPIELQ